MGRVIVGIIVGLIVLSGNSATDNSLFEMPDGVQSRWASFENPLGEKGRGGMANKGGKGAAFDLVKAGETKVLMDVQGCGVIHRMWFTLSAREPQSLRSYVFRCYWDGAEKPAVEVPFGDFFGASHGKMVAFESELFANPEDRSFNSYVPMPFRSAARVTFTNESSRDLDQLFYDINYTLHGNHGDNMLYFHASWRRERWTELGKDFEILHRVEGRVRFLGAHIGILGHPDNRGWWGEGEVKMYMDGDTDFPTIVGTGTEDYVGTAYGQGEFSGRYQGSLIIDDAKRRYAFYRHHVPDPIYFHRNLRVSLQQMGGAGKKEVAQLLQKGVDIQPVSIHDNRQFVKLLEMDPVPDVRTDRSLPEGWTNFYRRDDVCAVALYYLDRPENNLPPIAPVEARIEALLE